MTFRWWTGFLTLCFCSAIVAFAFVARKPLCIDSTVVERFDIISSTGTHSIYSCDLRHHVSYQQFFADRILDWKKRLKPIEQWLQFSNVNIPRLHFTFLSHDKKSFRLHGSEVFMGLPLLEEERSLENAVIKSIIRTRANKSIIENPVLEQSFADLFTMIVLNQSEFLHPDQRWPRVLQLTETYCNSVTVFPEHKTNCGSLLEGDLGKLTAFSVRPLLSQSLIRSYLKLGKDQQISLQENFLSQLPKIEIRDKKYGQSVEHSDRQEYYELGLYLSNLIENLASSDLQFPAFTQLIKGARHELEIAGFKEDFNTTIIDYLIKIDEVTERDLERWNKMADENSWLNIAIETSDAQYLLPTNSPVRKGSFGDFKSYRSIWFQCGLPTWQEISTSILQSHKILVIDSCKDVDVDLSYYIEEGIKDFASHNKDVGFIHIHVPSFLLAVKKGLNPFAWDQSEFVKSANAFKNNGPIQSIDWFRGLQP